MPEIVRSFCSSAAQVGAAAAADSLSAGTPIKFVRLYGQGGQAQDALRCVVRTWEQWERLVKYAKLRGFEAITPALFRGSVLIFVSMGEQPTGGVGVSILSASATRGELVVRVRSDSGTGDEPVTMGFTYPAEMIRVDGSYRTVRFLEE